MVDKCLTLLTCHATLSPELGEDDGSGDSYVEALGCGGVGWIGGDTQAVGYNAANGFGEAIALIAHDNDAATLGGYGVGGVDVVAVKQGAIYG